MDLATTAALIMLIGTVFFLIIGTPISISVGISSFAAMLVILPYQGATVTSAQRIFVGLDSFALLAIPFFILAGNIMNSGGIALKLINFSKIISGFFPGSLAQTNIVSNMLFGAISGSGVASAAAVGGIMSPIAQKEGYDPKFSAAVNIASAPTGMLIPPSNTLIVYATVAGSVSVSALFMAGYLPGILWGTSVMIIAGWFAKKRGYITKHHMTFSECIKVSFSAIPSLSLIVVVIGGILAGIFTATEASAIAVMYSLLLSFCYRTLTLKQLPDILLQTAKMSAIVIFMLAASSIMSWVMAFTQIPGMIANMLLALTDNPILILFIINIILLIVGTFMDPTPAVLIFTPIFLPICINLGMSPIQFGIMLVFNLSLGTITPPVGPILFTGCKVSNISIDQVIKALLPFFAAIFFVLLLVTYIPSISLFLPDVMGLIK
ncbi:TRAP transporter large permease [Testudinibacter sp. TR-2022]|uniref:TRAP transporter large permease n=1 Tax=Testudinibacter sp. TR-2022 TaxID=2585029 RepID=UPI00111B7DC3|nr:TRAP transporter large permease [Testudinibacter sp. TR-2022]TNH02210.1 TRAP transporter large permease [Pasteurellaceae bacterium Phil31]TNH08125.1 TRAP transporter large permease [Testudinibacter sp. TR-2022]TNH10789.1 TRAP transporter large permease [Testudinibacter sp. TR-2022]TNH16475.1 TRAP transporter large permease [Testudinibacter sp. TR-2022]TNH19518.1 TRAP transporter large permease [Testudinibacter sp. TR-2022]